jgi:hypothetical protein
MIVNDPLEPLEPKERERSQDLAFTLDSRGQDTVEGGDAICGDDQQLFARDAVNVAHLPAPDELET